MTNAQTESRELFTTSKPKFAPRYTVINSFLESGKAVFWSTNLTVSLAEMSEAAEREFAGVPVEKLTVLSHPNGLQAQS